MKLFSPTTSLVLAALIGTAGLQPAAYASAEKRDAKSDIIITDSTGAGFLGTASLQPVPGAPAEKRDAKSDVIVNGSAGGYDGFDRFRDESGRAQQGWEYLFQSAG